MKDCTDSGLWALAVTLCLGCSKPASPTEGSSPSTTAPATPTAAAAPALAAQPVTSTAAESPPPGSARPAHFGYSGAEGPANWAGLSPAYAACAGTRQSPIDLLGPSATPGKWVVAYKTTSLRIAHHEHVHDLIDNGHTIQVTVDEGSTLTSGSDVYALKQFHFHTPSEHTVLGKRFPMEAHFVHQSESGKFAVVSALYEEGAESPTLATLIANFPAKKGDKILVASERVDLSLHVPAGQKVHSYVGSLTTPPCTEGVAWQIFEKPLSASPAQLAAFTARLAPNNRPTQALGSRQVATMAVTTAPL
jgi:carbonic anhydrase